MPDMKSTCKTGPETTLEGFTKSFILTRMHNSDYYELVCILAPLCTLPHTLNRFTYFLYRREGYVGIAPKWPLWMPYIFYIEIIPLPAWYSYFGHNKEAYKSPRSRAESTMKQGRREYQFHRIINHHQLIDVITIVCSPLRVFCSHSRLLECCGGGWCRWCCISPCCCRLGYVFVPNWISLFLGLLPPTDGRLWTIGWV